MRIAMLMMEVDGINSFDLLTVCLCDLVFECVQYAKVCR